MSQLIAQSRAVKAYINRQYFATQQRRAHTPGSTTQGRGMIFFSILKCSSSDDCCNLHWQLTSSAARSGRGWGQAVMKLLNPKDTISVWLEMIIATKWFCKRKRCVILRDAWFAGCERKWANFSWNLICTENDHLKGVCIDDMVSHLVAVANYSWHFLMLVNHKMPETRSWRLKYQANKSSKKLSSPARL